MKKILSFLMLMFAAVTLVFAQDPETLASGTFDGKNGTYTEGWSTTGTGVGRNDCVVIGAGENITSPEVDLSSYESITVSIKARRYGSLTGKVATIAVTFDGEDIGTVDASTTTATTALDAIDYTVDGLTTGNFVFTCSNATSAGSSHGAGINSIVITGVKSQGGTGTSTKETVYLVNASNWTKPTIHMWGGTANGTSWPGMEMTKTSTQLKGADVYSYTADKGAYANCIFSDNGANQTGDLDWTAGKYYYMNKWYSYDELAGGGEIQVDYYLKNNWDQADAWTWKKTTPVGDGTYKLENVVFGGTGVNWYTEPVENMNMSNYWIPATDFKGDEVAAGNTVTFVFDPKAKTITATLVGGTTPVDPPITIAYDTVYLVNTLGWATPYCYHWGDYTVQPQWPGEAMTKTEDKVGSYDVYMYVAKEGALSKCIFNNGDAENTIQTEDLKPIQDVGKNDKYYVPGNQQDEVGAYIGGTWYATLDAISGNQLAAGFYLIGLKGWTVADLNADLKFAETTTDNVYSLTVTLVKDQEFKAVYVNDQGAIANWMPKDGDNFVVTDKYAGEKTVLLNVTGQGGEGWFGGYIYVEPNPEQPEQPTDPTYYLKNNWNGGEWTWKEMTKIEEDDDLYYVLSNVVFGGTGVDLNTEMNDEESATKKWYAVADIPAYDAKSVELDPVVLGALDTVTFIYTPGADAILAAYLLGKYQEGGDPIVPPTPEVIYSVAGSKALLGAEWNEKEGNEMALDPKDGLYKLLCADVTLAGGTEYKFKIVTNHDWSNPSYPAQDKILTVDKDGKYDVTITFNAGTEEVAYVAEFKGSAVVEKHYLIVGDSVIANGQKWNNAAEINLMKSADEGLTYTLVVENAELAAETPYGYKVVEQGSWTEYFPNIGGDNAYFAVEAAGVYTITYTYTVATSQCVAITTKTGDIPGPVDPETPVDSMTVYFYNNLAWENVNVFVWNNVDGAYKEWSGEAAKKEAEQINGVDVYSYTFPAKYTSVIFNNGTIQTVDLVWDAEKPYFVPNGTPDEYGKYDGKWYAKADIPGDEPVDDPFVGFDARTEALGTQIAAGLAKNLVNVTFVETSEGKYSINLVEGGVEGTFSFGGVVFAYKNSAAGTTAWKTFGTYIQPNGKDREVRIPLKAGEQVNVVLTEACEGVLVDGESMNLAAGDNLLTATADGLVLKSASTKPKIQAILPVTPEPPTPGDTYYMKNNWEAGADWTWKEMTQDGEIYKLENVVFGGTGVNYSTSMDDPDPAWVPVDDISGDEIAAKDTVTFVLNPVKATVTATLIGKYQEGGDPIVPPTPEVIYSVAGSKALLGAEWNEKEGNEMALDPKDGLYKLLCADVTLAGGTEYKFKIVTNHDWTNPNYPDQDKVLTVDEDGKYDVTITFNADTKDVAYVAEFKGGAVVEKHYLIVGDAAIANDEDWNNAAETNLMKSEDEGLTYKLVVTGAKLIANREYGYKVVEQGTWTEYFPKKEGAANEYFSVEADGVYTITYTYTVATSQCAVVTTKTGELPEPTLKDGFYLVGTFDGVAAWTVDDLNASKQFQFIEKTETYTAYAIMADLKVGDMFKVVLIQQDVIAYWMPDGQDNEYIVNANEAGEGKIIYLIFTNEGYYYYVEPNLYDGYYLVGTMNNWTPAKEYLFAQNPGNTAEYVLSTTLAENDQFKVVYVYEGEIQNEWYPAAENSDYTVDAAHAGKKDIYFRPDYQGGEDWYYGCIYVAANEPTGIEETIAAGKAAKVLRNGQILILKGDKMYNVMGAVIR